MRSSCMKALVFATLIQTSSPTYAQSPARTEENLLKDWALSRCLSYSFKNQPAGEDAAVTASALLQRADSGMGVYEKLGQLAASYAARKYSGSVPGDYHVLKCIDLFHSTDLAHAVRPIERKRLQKIYDQKERSSLSK